MIDFEGIHQTTLNRFHKLLPDQFQTETLIVFLSGAAAWGVYLPYLTILLVREVAR